MQYKGLRPTGQVNEVSHRVQVHILSEDKINVVFCLFFVFFGAKGYVLIIGIEEKVNVVVSIGSLVCLGGLEHFLFDFYISH